MPYDTPAPPRPPHAFGLLLALCLGLGVLAPPRADAAPAPRATPVAPSDKAAETVKEAARKHFAEGKKRFALRQFRAALQSFSKAYELLPLSGFLFNIGQCHRFLGDCQKAIFFYSGFVRENPGTPDAAFVQKLIGRCEKDLQKDEARRRTAAALFEEARKALTLQQYDQALAQLTEAYKLFPLPGYLYHLGEVHRARKAWRKAIHFYRAYLRETPGGPQAKQVQATITESQKLQEEQDRKDAAAGRIRRDLDLGRAGRDGPPPPPPLYKRWWFWTALSVGVAAAVGLGVGLGTREDGRTQGSLTNWKVVLP